MKHPREPQNTAEHGHVFRPRLEGRRDSSSDDEEEKQGDGDYEAPADDAMEEDGVDPDEAWHTKKGLTFVEVGKRFEVGGREYQRTAERGAKCTTCEHPFGMHSYNLRALGAHATKCLRIAAEKARRALAGAAAAWTGTVSCTHTFDGGHAVTVDFAKVVVDGKNALQCQSCDTELLQTAEYFQERHVQSRHVPELVNTKLRKLVRRACDPNIASSGMKHQYLNFSQLQTRLKDRRSQYRDQSLRALTATSKVRSLTKVATSFNRVVAALATKKLPRLHIVARRLLERGSTHRVVVRQMERAVEGYIPKGDFERIDYQKAYVALALGGRRALRLEMADDGGPSRRTLTRQKVYDVPRFIACAGLLQVQSLLENMEKTFGARPPKPGEERALFHLAIDNVNLEERLRYAFGDERTGGLRIARESSFDGDLTIKSEEDVERITAAFDEAELLLPKEATVAVLIKNDDSMCDSSVERERVFGGVSRGRGGCRSARGPIAARLRGLPRRRAGPSATARSRAECQSKHPACSREITPVFMSGTAKPSGYGKAAQDQAWIVEKVIEI